MDPIITKLNQIAQEKIKGGSGSQAGAEGSSFQKVFDQSLNERLMERLGDQAGVNSQNEMTAVSAENIQVTTDASEVGPTKTAANEQFFNTFKEVNNDLLGLDAALETLTTPGVKLDARQLLSLQAGVAQTSIMAEAFGRFTQSVSQGINAIFQTQV